jgi:regulator of protease activity HflC (stomatin/prohibitin superfamily)
MSERLLSMPALPAKSQLRLKLAMVGLLALFVLLCLWRSIFIPIGSGHAGVLWSRLGGGTVMGRVYGEGYTAIWPWDEMTVYETRLQQMHDTVQVLTSDGLQVSLGVTVRFAPRLGDLTQLHRSVGPTYRRTVVWPDVIAAVRRVVRQSKADDLRVIGEADLAARVNGAASESVQNHWVDLDRVLITRITLPGPVETQIEARLAEEQKALAAPFLLQQAETERQRWLIEADSVREFEARAQVPMLKWRGLDVLERLAASPNSKVVVLGGGQGQLPILLDPDRGGAAITSAAVGQAERLHEQAEAEHQH